MGLIADVVESVKAALGGVAVGWRDLARLGPPGLEELAEALSKIKLEDIGDVLAFVGPGSSPFLAEAVTFSVDALQDPKTFIKELFDSWSLRMNQATALLNVDSPEGFETLDFGNVEIAASALRVQGASAGNRVAAAIALINVIVLGANAVSLVAEGFSGGVLRGIAEAVQSWVWANGVGGLSGMAYQPQLNASVFPWLNRLNQFKAQATIPGEGDLVRFQLREVFEVQRRAELLAGPERPTFDHYMRERGLTKYWADSFWAAHWVLPSIGQLNEMLFRGVIDRDEWERFVRFNDFDPSSIPRLGEIIFNPFTRVDVRRMARLGVLNEQEQLQAYADLGNFAETAKDAAGKIRAQFKSNPDFTVDKAQALVVFTRLFNALPELRARFRNGWISSEELLEELLATGVGAAKARTNWETIVKADKEARVAPEKALTRGLVARAWKLRFVSFPQAVFLLERMGWDNAEAELILRVQDVPVDIEDFAPSLLGTRLVGQVIGVSPIPVDDEDE